MTLRMDLGSQVVSRKLANVMKTLGFSQDSLWYHVKYEDDSYLDVVGASKPDPCYRIIQNGTFESVQFDEMYAAYTVAELGEMLPRDYITGKLTVDCDMFKKWCCIYLSIPEFEPWLDRCQFADTEANARAQMLILLAKEGYI